MNMNRIIVSFLIMLLFAPAAYTEIAEKSVIFTTTSQTFALISTAMGKVSQSDPFISVKLDQYTMRANNNYKPPVDVLRYKIGLAFQEPNGQWNVERWSEAVEVNEIIHPGQTKTIKNYETVIPIDGLRSLKEYWLVLAVETKINGRNGYTYAHSEKGLF